MGKLYDRVKVGTATTGTGTITLAATGDRSISSGDFLSFAEAGIPTGTLVTYFIQDGANWASGEGVYTAAGNTLSRDTNEVRWDGSMLAAGKLVLSGLAKVFISARASDLAPWPSTQTWQNVQASRTHNTTYQNVTGKPIEVAIQVRGSGGVFPEFKVSSDGMAWITVLGALFFNGDTNRSAYGTAIVPSGWFYRLEAPASTPSISVWSELR